MASADASARDDDALTTAAFVFVFSVALCFFASALAFSVAVDAFLESFCVAASRLGAYALCDTIFWKVERD